MMIKNLLNIALLCLTTASFAQNQNGQSAVPLQKAALRKNPYLELPLGAIKAGAG
ncbi:hypothetical protein [Pedobacter sp. HDW13]|uniref:hypothetical protein n=1 Tax=Pedobacter sp. HDW13 TaxID=2714940 RepID=UPI001F10A68D|nr:hypothetical protein [Pedobacter sp. HDW13]